MITINEIDQKYDFPSIDFKFQNTGDATAILSEFRVIVNRINLDLTPVFKFSYHVKGYSLEIYAKNNGFGKALNCEITVTSPELESIFPLTSRTFKGNISSNEEQKILTLSYNSSLSEKLDKVMKDKKVENSSFSFFDHYDGIGLIIGNLHAEWRAKSETNDTHQNSEHVYSPGPGLLLFLKDGFYFNHHHVSYCLMPPTQTYCVLIDTDKGTHFRTYPISRKISSGDGDRFHILVGATKSSSINLQFQFKIDSNTFVKSQEFGIKIFNPLGNNLRHRYIDGDIFSTPTFRRKGFDIDLYSQTEKIRLTMQK